MITRNSSALCISETTIAGKNDIAIIIIIENQALPVLLRTPDIIVKQRDIRKTSLVKKINTYLFRLAQVKTGTFEAGLFNYKKGFSNFCKIDI
ncbi:hypothetical protein GJ496_002621 [Pomphorhynchus laevis]|nr:hypothetical protein GJ496_002621 [Pomphorhynchus laevis]